MRIIIGLVCGLLAGCGACQRVASHQQAFRAEAPARPSGPQISVDIPARLIERGLDTAVAALPTADYRLPGLGDIGRYLGDYSVAARSLSLRADVDDGVAFDLDFDIKGGRRTLLGMELRAKAPIEYDREAGKAIIKLRADMFEKVKPKLPAGAVEKLTNALYAEMPSVARALLDRRTVRRAVSRGMDEIVDRAYTLLRSRVLRPMGEIARFEVDLPQSVPIAGLGLHAGRGGDLRLDVRTTLNAAGLPSGNPKRRPEADRLRLRVSTDTVVALGNWAMGRGHIPARYNKDGKAQKDGPFTAGLDWQQGARPMKVNLWSTSGGGPAGVCMRVKAGASPQVTFREGKLSVGVEGGKIEEIDPPLLELALDITGSSQRAFDYTKKFATGTELKLGKRRYGVHLRSARMDARTLELELDTDGLSPARKKRKKRTAKKKPRRT